MYDFMAWFGFVMFVGFGAIGLYKAWVFLDQRLRTRQSQVVLPAGDIINAIYEANPNRTHTNLVRRILKLSEEMGETAEAYLNVTSASNGKKKTWDDVREELADCVIVALDCAMTPMPDQEGITKDAIMAQFSDEITAKLAKWKNNRDTGKAATDAE